jgi:hypothetical protein
MMKFPHLEIMSLYLNDNDYYRADRYGPVVVKRGGGSYEAFMGSASVMFRLDDDPRVVYDALKLKEMFS